MSANLDNQFHFQKKEEREKRNESIKDKVFKSKSKTIPFKSKTESIKKEVFWEKSEESVEKSELDKKLDSHFEPNNIIEEHRKNLLAIWMNEDLVNDFLQRVYDIKAQVSSTLWEDFVVWVISNNTQNLAEKFETYNQARVSRAIIQPLILNAA